MKTLNEIQVKTALDLVVENPLEYLRLPVELRENEEIALAALSKKSEDGTPDEDFYYENNDEWIETFPKSLMYSVDFHMKAVERQSFLAIVGPAEVLVSPRLLFRIAELYGMDTFANAISGEDYDECVRFNKKGDTAVSAKAAQDFYNELMFEKMQEFGRIKSTEERKIYVENFFVQFNQTLATTNLLGEVIGDFGELSIPYLKERTEDPYIWGVAALSSKEAWLSVPAKLRTDKKFVFEVVSRFATIYFYLKDEEREENESLAFAFLQALSNSGTTAYDVAEEWTFPVSFSEDRQFSFHACKRWNDFSYFVPEPLRSDITFAEELANINSRCVIGLFFPATESSDISDWSQEKITEVVSAHVQKANYLSQVPKATTSKGSKFKL